MECTFAYALTDPWDVPELVANGDIPMGKADTSIGKVKLGEKIPPLNPEKNEDVVDPPVFSGALLTNIV